MDKLAGVDFFFAVHTAGPCSSSNSSHSFLSFFAAHTAGPSRTTSATAWTSAAGSTRWATGGRSGYSGSTREEEEEEDQEDAETSPSALHTP